MDWTKMERRAPYGTDPDRQYWEDRYYQLEERMQRADALRAELVEALRVMVDAAACRENTMGDPCRLIEVQAELRSAVANARALLARADGAR